MLKWVLFTVMCQTLICPAFAQEESCIFDANKASTVYIEYKYATDYDGDGSQQGSGFIISPTGHVLTNAHVVSPSIKDIKIKSSSISVRVGGLFKPTIEAQVVNIDQSNDLALLKLPKRPDGGNWQPVVVGNSPNLNVGASLMALGFGGGGDIAIVPDGKKTTDNCSVGGELKPWWQTNLGLNSGNRGGPIFGELGTVVGVAVAIETTGQLISYIIPITRAEHFLKIAEVKSAEFGPCAKIPKPPPPPKPDRCEEIHKEINRLEIEITGINHRVARSGAEAQEKFDQNHERSEKVLKLIEEREGMSLSCPPVNSPPPEFVALIPKLILDQCDGDIRTIKTHKERIKTAADPEKRLLRSFIEFGKKRRASMGCPDVFPY
jgi:hypothetical protein